MKIKEVIEKTGLTDRAIRLYIDEGLAVPSIAENYSGRKSIEFSESDVERLKNIALLRKAGFSVAEIKSLVDDKDTAKGIIENFIAKTEKNIAEETEIVERLKNISFDEDVTLETICDSLSAAVEETEVPREDMKLSVGERIAKLAIIALSSVFALQAIWMFITCCSAIFDVRYIKLTDNIGQIMGSLFYLVWAWIAIALIVFIYRNVGKRFNRKTEGSLLSLVFSVIGTFIMLPITFLLLFCTMTPFYSQTTDPKNYLKLEHRMMDEGLGYISEIFPSKIPYTVKDTNPDSIKYFYEFTPCWDGLYGTYDICAEWILPDNEFETFKKDLKGNFILEDTLLAIQNMNTKDEYRIYYATESAIEKSGYNVVKKGDWTMIYYEGYGQVDFDYNLPVGENPEKRCEDELLYEESKNEFEIKKWDGSIGDVRYRTQYDFLICAYNDKEQKVRYIASTCCGHANRDEGPHYLSLDW